MKREQFTFYRSYYEALKHLSKRDRADVLMAVIAYALDEEVPKLSGVPLSVFTLIRPTLDSGRNKARNRVIKRETKAEQNDNKTEQMRKEKEGEVEREKEREGECERELEGDSPLVTPPAPPVSASAAVLSDYLNRVNPAASPASLDELKGYAEQMGKDVCIRAIDIALDSKKATWPYIRAILRDKLQRGVKCLADWDALEEQRQADKTAPWHYDPGSLEGSL